MNILVEIAGKRKLHLESKKKQVPLKELQEKVYHMQTRTDFPFETEMKKEGMSFICEVKKASPSKGLIAKDFPYLSIAKEYEQAGAAAISVLTEPDYFLGCDQYLAEISAAVSIPVLRKDFIIDEYQIYESRLLGASAVLLICTLLTLPQLIEYQKLARSLGLSALVEAHDEEELSMALKADASIIGINNRNLKDFSVDMNNSVRLRSMVPPDKAFISESGIHTPLDIKILKKASVDGVLIGESLMREKDKKAALKRLKAE